MRAAPIAAALLIAVIVDGLAPACALEIIKVRVDVPAIDLTEELAYERTPTSRIRLTAAPSFDGRSRELDIRAAEAGTTHWALFALANETDEQVERLLVAPRYWKSGSGPIFPGFGLSRVMRLTASGESPGRQASAVADIFLLTLDPGSVTTVVAELRTDWLPQVYLWEPDAYRQEVDTAMLYANIAIGGGATAVLVLILLLALRRRRIG
jgi:hypothetical protein